MKKQSRFEQRNNEIVALYCENNTLLFIAEKFNLTHQGVRYILQSLGISTKARKRKPPTKMFRKTRLTSRERFWSKVDIKNNADECWLWVAKTKSAFGYGIMRYQGKQRLSHHLAYLFANGKRAVNWVLHDCGNASCCNPKHLKDGTPKENAQDRIRHGRNKEFGRKGESHGRARLSDAQVREIKSLLNTKRMSHSEIGKQYSVSKSTISGISANKSWQHIQV